MESDEEARMFDERLCVGMRGCTLLAHAMDGLEFEQPFPARVQLATRQGREMSDAATCLSHDKGVPRQGDYIQEAGRPAIPQSIACAPKANGEMGRASYVATGSRGEGRKRHS